MIYRAALVCATGIIVSSAVADPPLSWVDCNQDGEADLLEVRAAPNDNDNNLWVGLVRKGSVTPLQTFAAPAPNIHFGYSAVIVPDGNGDGVADVVIAAPGAGAGTAHGPFGAVYLYSSVSGQLIRQWTGEPNDALGFDIRLIPDWNNNGPDDLEILGFAFSGDFLIGRSRVVSLATGAVVCDDAFETVPQDIAASNDPIEIKASFKARKRASQIADLQEFVCRAGQKPQLVRSSYAWSPSRSWTQRASRGFTLTKTLTAIGVVGTVATGVSIVIHREEVIRAFEERVVPKLCTANLLAPPAPPSQQGYDPVRYGDAVSEAMEELNWWIETHLGSTSPGGKLLVLGAFYKMIGDPLYRQSLEPEDPEEPDDPDIPVPSY